MRKSVIAVSAISAALGTGCLSDGPRAPAGPGAASGDAASGISAVSGASGVANSSGQSTGAAGSAVATGNTGASSASASGTANAVATGSSGASSPSSSGTVSGGASGQAGASLGPSDSGDASTVGASADGGASDGGDPFVLAWQDDFNTLDPTLWALQTFTFSGNLAQFSTANATAANGMVTINLTPMPSDTAEPYRGVEMRSTKTLTYGKVAARIRFAKGPGVVSGLVLIYTPYPADDWNEIDIEHLGKTSNAAQLNCQVYLGAPVQQPVTTSVTPTQDPQLVTLGFDTESDFHEYDIEWTPTAVNFIIDGTIARTWTQNIARMKLPQNILFTIWASSAASWAGTLTSTSAPTSADIDWIKVYDWKG